MRNCALNIKEQKRKFELITETLLRLLLRLPWVYDRIPAGLLTPGGNIPATVAVIPKDTIERKTPASHPAQDPLTDL